MNGETKELPPCPVCGSKIITKDVNTRDRQDAFFCLDCKCGWTENRRAKPPTPEVPPVPITDYECMGGMGSWLNSDDGPLSVIATIGYRLAIQDDRDEDQAMLWRKWLRECDRRGCTAGQVVAALLGEEKR